jgi:DNA-binding CsgD family transcriptional regulator
MYKQLPITSNISEMLVSVKSLPTCTIIFDTKADLVDMNKLASDFLKIDNVDDYLNKRSILDVDYLKLSKVIQKLKKGNLIFDEIIRINREDGKSIDVVFNACMLYGSQKVFLFQFFKVASPINSDSRLLINAGEDAVKIKQLNLGRRKKSEISIESGERPNINIHQQCIQDQLLVRYPILTAMDAVICGLILKGKTMKEIAEILQKTRNNIYGNVKLIMQKLEVKSARELYNILCVDK